MKAIALVPGTTDLRMVDRPEPVVGADDEVKVRVLEVGICGTDREEAAGGRARAADGRTDLIIGHEMLGRVVAVGRSVRRVSPGDLAVVTVRRGCSRCGPCSRGRPDMCRTGDYRERGIWGLDGFQTELVVDREEHVVPVPAELRELGVLTEPLSVAEKAIEEAVTLQAARLPDETAASTWLGGRRCLVAGLGPIGLLAALALRLRDAEVWGLDIVAPDTARAEVLRALGGRYLDGRQRAARDLAAQVGAMDLVVEATGVPALAFNLLDALALDGLCVLTGIPGGDRPLQVPGAEIVRRLVLGNRIMVGSVNAAPRHFQVAVEDLARARRRWGERLDGLVTHRHPAADFRAALAHGGDEEIKVVLEWPEP